MNLYWPIYKNLEKEVIDISNNIHFDDSQTKVYSMKIADLIVRCAIEIESISKNLYQQLGGNMEPKNDLGNSRDIYFDTDCIQLLENKWNICKKEIQISASNFYFEKLENTILTPLKKCNERSKGRWKKAYQNIKHDRIHNLKDGNIENLLNALGALYILNLYYKDENFFTNEKNCNIIFDNRVGSEIFSVFVAHAEKISVGNNLSDDDIDQSVKNELERSIYIQKYKEESIRFMHKEVVSNNSKFLDKLLNSNEVIDYLQKNEISPGMNPFDLARKAGGDQLFKELLSVSHFNIRPSQLYHEIILNKSEKIYPDLKPNDL